MPRIIYLGSDGERNEIDAPAGNTMMEVAIDNNVAGIVAECGGACACATCHTYISEAWLDKLPDISEMEDAMLDAVIDRRSNSRLACQIEITAALDGLEAQAADNEA